MQKETLSFGPRRISKFDTLSVVYFIVNLLIQFSANAQDLDGFRRMRLHSL
jgi:hypothetical protein